MSKLGAVKSVLGVVRKVAGYSVAGTMLSSMFLSVGMQFAPGLAGDSVDDFLTEKDYPPELSSFFNSENIYVYGRENILSSFHAMGIPVARIWEDDYNMFEKVLDTLLSPLILIASGVEQFDEYTRKEIAADAYALPAYGRCFVRPPADGLGVNDALFALSGIDKFENLTLKVSSDIDELGRAFRAFIMAHELQHCVQEWRSLADNVKESDADVVALKVMPQLGFDKEIVEEMSRLLLAARIVGSLGPEVAHDTALGILDFHATPLQSHLQASVYNLVSDVTDDIVANTRFPLGVEESEQRYHALRVIKEQGIFEKEHSEAHSYVETALWAFSYLHDVSGRQLIARPHYYQRIHPSFLDKEISSSVPDLPTYSFGV